MPAFLALLLQYLPQIFSVVQTVETISTSLAAKPTSSAKLQAAIGMVSAVVPAIGASIAAQPENATHATNVINGIVAATNALGAFAAQQASPSGT
jgi:hypothetical protein